MRRVVLAAAPLALLVAGALGTRFLVEESHAELDNQVFTSAADRLRLVVPRGWRATDHPSYPGLLLWMMRTQPPGQIVLTAEPFTRALYCTWPAACRATPDAPVAQLACALRTKLGAQRFRVGPAQAGPKENDEAGLPSLWFEYEDGKRFLRQAVAIAGDRAISLVLSAPTSDARASHARPFDQALRTLRVLTLAETTAFATGRTPIDAGPIDPDALPAPASPDAPAPDGGLTVSAPPPKVEPVGPCPQ